MIEACNCGQWLLMLHPSLSFSSESFQERCLPWTTAGANHAVVCDQEHQRADGRDEQAITIQPSRPTLAQKIRQKTAEDSSENTQEHVADQTSTRLINNPATHESD